MLIIMAYVRAVSFNSIVVATEKPLEGNYCFADKKNGREDFYADEQRRLLAEGGDGIDVTWR